MIDWTTLLAPSVEWREAYAHVEREARSYLSGFGEDWCTTMDLAEALFPEALARGEGITARKRIYKALAALATRQLADCCTRGELRKLKHGTKMVRPWLWHAPGVEFNSEYQPDKQSTCPHCGGTL